MKTMNVTEFRALEADQAASLNCLDVRRDDEVAKGIMPGAVHIPLHELAARYGELDAGVAWVVYCHKGGRSANACAFLAEQGYDVTNLEGGYADYQDAL